MARRTAVAAITGEEILRMATPGPADEPELGEQQRAPDPEPEQGPAQHPLLAQLLTDIDETQDRLNMLRRLLSILESGADTGTTDALIAYLTGIHQQTEQEPPEPRHRTVRAHGNGSKRAAGSAMTAAQRKAVSERMRRYWAERKRSEGKK